MRANGFRLCVCFSCGNASRTLKEHGVPCVAVAPDGDLLAGRWWTTAEIHRTFPTAFDATSGQLPADVMLQIAHEFREEFAPVFADGGKAYVIPTGSGETVLCLKLAFPDRTFIAQWRTGDPNCEYEPCAPLTPFVQALIPWEIVPADDTLTK
jgi:hypothetical protein